MGEALESLLKSRGGDLIHIHQLREIGQAHPGNFDIKPEPEDISALMYTSGSMGTPKGCIITHKNMISSLAGANRLCVPHLAKTEHFLAFLVSPEF